MAAGVSRAGPLDMCLCDDGVAPALLHTCSPCYQGCPVGGGIGICWGCRSTEFYKLATAAPAFSLIKQYMLLPYPEGTMLCVPGGVTRCVCCWEPICHLRFAGCCAHVCPWVANRIRGCVGKNKGHWGMCWGQRRAYDVLLIVITPINVLITASSLQLSMPSAQLSDRSLSAAVATCSTSP
jgi:hypothetical protein